MTTQVNALSKKPSSFLTPSTPSSNWEGRKVQVIQSRGFSLLCGAIFLGLVGAAALGLSLAHIPLFLLSAEKLAYVAIGAFGGSILGSAAAYYRSTSQNPQDTNSQSNSTRVVASPSPSYYRHGLSDLSAHISDENRSPLSPSPEAALTEDQKEKNLADVVAHVIALRKREEKLELTKAQQKELADVMVFAIVLSEPTDKQKELANAIANTITLRDQFLEATPSEAFTSVYNTLARLQQDPEIHNQELNTQISQRLIKLHSAYEDYKAKIAIRMERSPAFNTFYENFNKYNPLIVQCHASIRIALLASLLNSTDTNEQIINKYHYDIESIRKQIDQLTELTDYFKALQIKNFPEVEQIKISEALERRKNECDPDRLKIDTDLRAAQENFAAKFEELYDSRRKNKATELETKIGKMNVEMINIRSIIDVLKEEKARNDQEIQNLSDSLENKRQALLRNPNPFAALYIHNSIARNQKSVTQEMERLKQSNTVNQTILTDKEDKLNALKEKREKLIEDLLGTRKEFSREILKR